MIFKIFGVQFPQYFTFKQKVFFQPRPERVKNFNSFQFHIFFFIIYVLSSCSIRTCCSRSSTDPCLCIDPKQKIQIGLDIWYCSGYLVFYQDTWISSILHYFLVKIHGKYIRQSTGPLYGNNRKQTKIIQYLLYYL